MAYRLWGIPSKWVLWVRNFLWGNIELKWYLIKIQSKGLYLFFALTQGRNRFGLFSAFVTRLGP